MSKIAIISDVNAGLDYIGYNPEIPVLRSIINFGDEHYIDGIDIKADEFYARIKADETLIPSTSAPTVGEAMELLEKLISEGYTDVIMYSISYQLSSIGQMVETLREEYGDKINIHVIDTKTATYLQGYMAVTAKEMVNKGCSVEEILAYSNYLVDNQHAYFVVDNLAYLVRNGRLSGAAGFMGSLLKIKPILEMNKAGKIVSKEKVKTHRKAVERALEMFVEEIKDAKKVKIFVFHTLREDEAKQIIKYLEEKCPNALPIELHMVTPAVGAHIGYGILGFGYFILEK
ncbi:MAG: DegV family protein [Bacilli bacterium]|nr:DegV family protein [Bacilli bacterium]